MNEMQITNYKGLDCYEKDGVAYLKLEQVAKGLGFTTIATSGNECVRWSRVEEYLKNIGYSSLVGKDVFIPENVFYRLAMKAKNDTAEKFQAWVADEVIPSIRKTGGYVNNANLFVETYFSDLPEEQKSLVRASLTTIENQKKKISEQEVVIEEQTKQIATLKPKALFADAICTSTNAILVRDFAKILKQNGYDTGEKRLYRWFKENGYICKGKGNSPTQRAMELGLFRVIYRPVDTGGELPEEKSTTLVTTKGQKYFVNKFLYEQGLKK